MPLAHRRDGVPPMIFMTMSALASLTGDVALIRVSLI